MGCTEMTKVQKMFSKQSFAALTIGVLCLPGVKSQSDSDTDSDVADELGNLDAPERYDTEFSRSRSPELKVKKKPEEVFNAEQFMTQCPEMPLHVCAAQTVTGAQEEVTPGGWMDPHELSLSGSEPPSKKHVRKGDYDIPTVPVLRGAGIGVLTMGRNNAAVSGMPPMDVTFSWEPKNVDPVMMGWNVTIMPRSRKDLFITGTKSP